MITGTTSNNYYREENVLSWWETMEVSASLSQRPRCLDDETWLRRKRPILCVRFRYPRLFPETHGRFGVRDPRLETGGDPTKRLDSDDTRLSLDAAWEVQMTRLSEEGMRRYKATSLLRDFRSWVKFLLHGKSRTTFTSVFRFNFNEL